MTDDTKDQLKRAANQATVALIELKSTIRQKAEEAAAKVRAQYADQLFKAEQDQWATQQALVQHVSDTASHPWEGKRVWRLKPRSRYSGAPGTTPQFGRLEVRRIGTDLPSNMRYGLPSYGEAFVRLELANGKPGLTIVTLNHQHPDNEWKLAE